MVNKAGTLKPSVQMLKESQFACRNRMRMMKLDEGGVNRSINGAGVLLST